MKKSLKKAFLTCAAVAAVMAAMSASAMAASIADDGTVTLEKQLPVADGKEATILVIPSDVDDTAVKDSDILYINQETKGADTFKSFKVDTSKLTAGKTYTIKLGGQEATAIEKDTFTYKGGPVEDIVYGDVTGEGDVKVNDAVKIVDYYLEKENSDLTEKQLKAADVNLDGEVKTNDAVAIVDYYLEKIDELPIQK